MAKGLLAGQLFKYFVGRVRGDVHHPLTRLQKLLHIGNQLAAGAGAGSAFAGAGAA